MIWDFQETITKLLDRILSILTFIVFVFIDIYINLRIFFRETSSIKRLNFKEYFVSIGNEDHAVCEIGDHEATSDKTLLLIGGIPTNPIESMSWLAEQLHKIDSTLRIIIFNIPYYDEHFAIEYSNEFAISNGESLITQKEIDFSTHKIDPKFSHVNQSKTVNLLMDEMGIDAAHVVGHDRGAVILENLCINNPERVITYSRGSQVWDYVDPKWKNLAPKILIGPPHRIMSIYHQFRLLFFAVMNLNKPIHLLSETFKINGRSSKRGSDIYDRYTHLKYKSQISYKNYFKKIQQSFLQGGIDNEVQNRINLKNTSIPIMQFQGEDEFKRASNGSLISDQPYFGKYNLFRNEIEDIYPSAVDQSSVPLKKEYVSDMGLYKEIQLKVGATFDKFFLIPDAAHFNVIENPKACASAIYNFINIEFNLDSDI